VTPPPQRTNSSPPGSSEDILLVTPVPSLCASPALNGSVACLIVDSGANISILRSDIAIEAHMVWTPYSPRLSTANGSALNVMGQASAQVDFNGHLYNHDFAICSPAEISFTGILGNDFLAKYRVDISYVRKGLVFDWGLFPLSYARPGCPYAADAVSLIAKMAQRRPRKVDFREDIEVICCSPTPLMEVEESPGEEPSTTPQPAGGVEPRSNHHDDHPEEDDPDNEVTNLDEPPLIDGCLLTLTSNKALQPDAYHVVPLKASLPPGTPLVIYGVDVGEGPDPEPTFSTVDRRHQAVVLFKNTGTMPGCITLALSARRMTCPAGHMWQRGGEGDLPATSRSLRRGFWKKKID
jgi:hypothetical protein